MHAFALNFRFKRSKKITYNNYFHPSIMQTIALIAVREGVVQLGSLKKVSPLSPFISQFFYTCVGPGFCLTMHTHDSCVAS
jgi:hypothetical protein